MRPVAAVGRVGRLTSLAFGEGTLWIGGSNGALAIGLPSGGSIDVPLDEPSAVTLPTAGGHEVRSIALAPAVAWIGTAAGIVRVRRDNGGLPR